MFIALLTGLIFCGIEDHPVYGYGGVWPKMGDSVSTLAVAPAGTTCACLSGARTCRRLNMYKGSMAPTPCSTSHSLCVGHGSLQRAMTDVAHSGSVRCAPAVSPLLGSPHPARSLYPSFIAEMERPVRVWPFARLAVLTCSPGGFPQGAGRLVRGEAIIRVSLLTSARTGMEFVLFVVPVRRICRRTPLHP
jgi:hypothetical protein